MLTGTELLNRELAARHARTLGTLHTIRPLRSCASDSKSVEQCPYEQAEYFGVYAYVRAGELELRHVDDQPTYADAMRYAQTNALELEPYCEHDDCTLAAYSAPMFLLQCSGGATGIMHGCATHFIEHMEQGGAEDDACMECSMCPACVVMITAADVEATECAQCGCKLGRMAA